MFYSAMCTCRLLATLIAVAQQSNAMTLNVTDDGMSMTGVFFSKLEAFRAKRKSEDIGTVRWPAPSQ
jgi:hypothetical protein